MLQKNDNLPDFSLSDQHGQIFTSKDWIGKKILVIYFYPKDFTPGCTAEACSFRDSYSVFTDAGAEVIGISSDAEARHLRFSNKHQLPFRLLTDPGGSVRKKFGVSGDLFGLIPGRATFIVDLKGKIALAFKSMQPQQHIQQALSTINHLKRS